MNDLEQAGVAAQNLRRKLSEHNIRRCYPEKFRNFSAVIVVEADENDIRNISFSQYAGFNIIFRKFDPSINEERVFSPVRKIQSRTLPNGRLKTDIRTTQDALSFFDFDKMPNKLELKTKFKAIVYKYHPDKHRDKSQDSQEYALRVIKAANQAKELISEIIGS